MNDLIISLAVDGRDKYSEIVKGLEKSIVDANWNGDVRIYKEFPDWCIPHGVIPYAFKYSLIAKAVEEGYKRIFWLDSVMRLVPGNSISDLLCSSEYGIIAFHNLGHDLKNYINDTAVFNLGIKDLEGIKQCWGGALFFDFNRLVPQILFDIICLHIELGSFEEDDITKREGFISHRHDQAVISYLINKYDIGLYEYGTIAAPKDVTNKTYIIYGDK